MKNTLLATKKSAEADFWRFYQSKVKPGLSPNKESLVQGLQNVKSEKKSAEVAGFAPAESWMIGQILHYGTPTPGVNITDRDLVVYGLYATNDIFGLSWQAKMTIDENDKTVLIFPRLTFTILELSL